MHGIDIDIDDININDDDIFLLPNVENTDNGQHQCYMMNYFILYPCSSFFELLITALCNQKYTERLKWQVKHGFFPKLKKSLSDPKIFCEEFKKIQKFIAFSNEIEFFDLDEEETKREKIIEIIEKQDFNLYPPVIFYSEGIPSSFDYPCQVLCQGNQKYLDILKYHISSAKYEECLKRANKYMNKMNQKYYVISFIIGAKNGVPVLVMFNQETKLEYYGMKVSENKTEIITSKDEIPKFIDTIYLLFYQIKTHDV